MSEVKIKSRKLDLEVSVNYEFATKVADAVASYGEDVVLNRFNRQINQELRAAVTRQVEADAERASKKPAKGEAKPAAANPQGVATASAASFRPTLTSGTSRAVKTIDKALAGLTEEEKALVMKALGTSIGNGGGDPLASA